MNKILLSALFLVAFTKISSAQTADSVSMGASYANNKWYSLANGELPNSAPANNWELGFATGTFGSSLIFNESIGTLYAIPGVGPEDFELSDTVGIKTWTKLYNSDTTWEYGAFNRPATGAFDYGYGTYNQVNHNIDGNRIFVVLFNNGSAKKLHVQLNYLGGPLGYDIVIVSSDIDNSNSKTYTFNKSTYTSKNFVYYSLTNNEVVDREPAKADWDLVFTKYVAATYGTATNQLVTGILQNEGVLVAEARKIGDANTYTNYAAHTFQSNISTIGEDWKYLNYITFQFEVEDSLIYFVKTQTEDIYKVIFTKFVGSSAGKSVFTKEKLVSSGIRNANGKSAGVVSVYPNPSADGQVTVLYNLDKSAGNTTLNITDIFGKTVYEQSLISSTEIQQEVINTSDFAKGMYVVSVRSGNDMVQQKLIIK